MTIINLSELYPHDCIELLFGKHISLYSKIGIKLMNRIKTFIEPKISTFSDYYKTLIIGVINSKAYDSFLISDFDVRMVHGTNIKYQRYGLCLRFADRDIRLHVMFDVIDSFQLSDIAYKSAGDWNIIYRKEGGYGVDW